MPKHPEQQSQHARSLRIDQTDVEKRLWRELRNRQLDGFKFRRQHGVGPYIVDFICIEAGLVVELDGGQHADQVSYDSRRSVFIEAAGYRVVRFWNNEVLENIEGVVERIHELLVGCPSPQPSPQRGEGV